jgi:sterol 24-C-methyltransferase
MPSIVLEKEDHQRDAEFNRALHGKSAQSRAGFAAMRSKDPQAQQAAVDDYFKHWDNKSVEEETEAIREVCEADSFVASLVPC